MIVVQPPQHNEILGLEGLYYMGDEANLTCKSRDRKLFSCRHIVKSCGQHEMETLNISISSVVYRISFSLKRKSRQRERCPDFLVSIYIFFQNEN